METMTEDLEGILWLGTTNGVIRFDPSGQHTFKQFTTIDGLVNNDIRCIRVDAAGNVWIGTSGGVSEFIQKENAFFNLTTAQGLSHNIVC
ncbi:MAG: hypothetical protein KDC05_16890, partial [Bacteroidales bacterium]|nr:hypothetical protein [Bacteroidales bacterium]